MHRSFKIEFFYPRRSKAGLFWSATRLKCNVFYLDMCCWKLAWIQVLDILGNAQVNQKTSTMRIIWKLKHQFMLFISCAFDIDEYGVLVKLVFLYSSVELQKQWGCLFGWIFDQMATSGLPAKPAGWREKVPAAATTLFQTAALILAANLAWWLRYGVVCALEALVYL